MVTCVLRKKNLTGINRCLSLQVNSRVKKVFAGFIKNHEIEFQTFQCHVMWQIKLLDSWLTTHSCSRTVTITVRNPQRCFKNFNDPDPDTFNEHEVSDRGGAQLNKTEEVYNTGLVIRKHYKEEHTTGCLNINFISKIIALKPSLSLKSKLNLLKKYFLT